MAETLLQTPWFSVESWPVEGSEHPYYLINHEDGVVVVPVTSDGRLILIRQFRPALGRVTLEFPAGGMAVNETPEQAARRELHEETGYLAGNMLLAAQGTLRLERERNLNHFFIAPNVELDPAFKPRERIETIPMRIDELKNLALNGGFDHLAALPALLLGAWRFGYDWGAP